MKTLRDSICAGVLIAIGGSVFLSCENKTVGAVLFAVALLCICYKGYYLFTGKVGYLAGQFTAAYAKELLLGLLGNLACTLVLGLLLRECLPGIGEKAAAMCTAKLEQAPLVTLVRGIFCGNLMYLAVSIYKEKNTALGILFCVPVFILSGFEHSIADMFYFGAAGSALLTAPRFVPFLLLVVLGNTLGGVALPLLKAKD